jgi:hypothetical protein
MGQPKLDKGPAEVLRALVSGDPERVQEAKAFQRESFRARFGCYPEEGETLPGDQVGVDVDGNPVWPDRAG